MKVLSSKTWVTVGMFSVALSSVAAVSCRDSDVSAPKQLDALKLRPVVAVRYARAHEKYAWPAMLHAQAMAEGIKERAGWNSNSADYHARNCALTRRITLKYAAIARGYAHLQIDARADSTIVTQALVAQGCGSLLQMNVFARSQSSLSLRATSASAVDGEFEYYGNAMVDAANNSSNTWSGIRNATMLALDNAYDYVDEFDFNVLSAEADYIQSSADTWFEYQQNGGFGVEEVQPMSIFHMYMIPWGMAGCGTYCRRVYKNDGLGFVAGALTAGKFTIEAALFGGLVWGVAGSLAT